MRFTSHKEADSVSSGKTAHDHELSHVEHLHESPETYHKLHDYYAQYPNAWARFRDIIREPAAEALGCMILIIFGDGVNAQVTLSSKTGVASSQKGEYLSISFLWAVGAALGVWASAGISGGHNNPVMTLAFAIFRGFPWKKVPGYILGQIFGAWLGGILVYANYFHAIDIFEGGSGVRTVPGTASIFATYALDYMPSAACFFDEFIGAFILAVVIFATLDTNNSPPPAGLFPLVIFLLILGIGAGWGMQTAYAINPARDIGPRIMTAMVGYGREVFNYRSQYWLWCAICGPLAGGLCGALFYDVFIYKGSDSPINRPSAAARRHLDVAVPGERQEAAEIV